MVRRQLLVGISMALFMFNAMASDLVQSSDRVEYSDERVRYSADLKADKPYKYKRLTPGQKTAGKAASYTPEKTVVKVKPRYLNDRLTVSFRNKTLENSIKRLTPPGWKIDMQIDKSLFQTLVSFSGETTYEQALSDVLTPQGLTFLPYKNMKPTPLLVITKGAIK